MKKSDQEEVLGREPGDWVWCLHCERVYQVGEYRLEKSSKDLINMGIDDGLQMCPYPECDGDTVIDAWEWEKIKEAHPDYPNTPERDKVYPLY